MNFPTGTEWYVSRNGQQLGPMSKAQLDEMHQTGKLEPSDHVWAAELGDWKLASAVLQFARATPPPPPPPARFGESRPVAPAMPTVTRTVVEGGSFKFGTFVWIVLALFIPLWPITLPICLFFAYRSYKKPSSQTISVISQ
jgi:hypothetical protein